MSPLHEYVAAPLGAVDSCQPCYDAKSLAYRACQEIPATQREARDTCFRAADSAIGKCLDSCGGNKGVSTGTLMLLGAGVAVLMLA